MPRCRGDPFAHHTTTQSNDPQRAIPREPQGADPSRASAAPPTRGAPVHKRAARAARPASAPGAAPRHVARGGCGRGPAPRCLPRVRQRPQVDGLPRVPDDVVRAVH